MDFSEDVSFATHSRESPRKLALGDLDSPHVSFTLTKSRAVTFSSSAVAAFLFRSLKDPETSKIVQRWAVVPVYQELKRLWETYIIKLTSYLHLDCNRWYKRDIYGLESAHDHYSVQ